MRTCHVDECPVGNVREFILDGQILAVCHVDGGFYVVDGICLHQGGPLGRGKLMGCQLTCPWHGWQYDVTTGCHASSSAVRLSVWQTEIRDDYVWVAPLSAADPAP
ncbi:MAG: Rieske 2Fe-2S domain-containing protein [Planctomycetota bacterium]|nr:Rieske 2Fe-2S domain-containing protein [Planctomycetota bacterium]MDA1180571.1 Rieske 2Fe-2S domain-containing protein [Planctomycetota bacterium]